MVVAAALAATVVAQPALAAGPAAPDQAVVSSAVPSAAVVSSAVPSAVPPRDPAGDVAVVATVLDAQGRPDFVQVTGATLAEAERRAERIPGAVEVEPDLPVHAVAADPLRAQQWAADALALDTLPAADTSGQLVAVIDSGVLAGHEDFAPGQVRCDLGIDLARDGRSTDGCVDPNGHGTHVAGSVAALRGNGRGVVGVAPGVAVLPVRVLDGNGAGWSSDIATGIRHAVDRGAQVLNLSLSGGRTSAVEEAVAYATSRGVLVVAAAGNNRASGNTPGWPAAAPGALAVAATDRTGTSGSFSYSGPEVDLAAPGVDILSLGAVSPSSYAGMSGTSMASPHVAGAAALYRALNPTATQADVQAAFLATATDVEAPGRDDNTGAGVLDLRRALAESPASRAQAPATPTALRAEPREARVDLGWDAVASTAGAPAEGYRVYRDGALLATTSSPAYVDAAPPAGRTVAYAVTAYGVGGESARSATASATVPAPPAPTPAEPAPAPAPEQPAPAPAPAQPAPAPAPAPVPAPAPPAPAVPNRPTAATVRVPQALAVGEALRVEGAGLRGRGPVTVVQTWKAEVRVVVKVRVGGRTVYRPVTRTTTKSVRIGRGAADRDGSLRLEVTPVPGVAQSTVSVLSVDRAGRRVVFTSPLTVG